MRFILSLIIIAATFASFDKIWDGVREGPVTVATFVKPVAETLNEGLHELIRAL